MVVIDVIKPEEYFTIDQYDDLASTQKPTLTIRQSDVKYVHAFVSKELEIIVYSSVNVVDIGTSCPRPATRHRHPIRIFTYD